MTDAHEVSVGGFGSAPMIDGAPLGSRIGAWVAPIQKRRFSRLDGLRAAAVLLVVAAHAGLRSVVPGGLGVTVFFVISGFIITHLVLVERERTGGFALGGFYARRAAKLMPPLVVLIILPTVAYGATNEVSWRAVSTQVLFVFNWFRLYGDSPGEVLPGSGVVWSLAIEEQFYIVFALLWLGSIRLSKRPERFLATVSGAAIIVSAVIRGAFVGDEVRIYLGTDTRMDAIAAGVLAAIAFRASANRRNAPFLQGAAGCDVTLVSSVAGLVATLLIRDDVFRDTVRYTLQALASAVLVLHFVSEPTGVVGRFVARAANLAPFQAIGLASYSIYLAHNPLFVALPAPHGIGGILLRVVIGVLIGVVAWRIVEVPIQRIRSRLRRSGRIGSSG